MVVFEDSHTNKEAVAMNIPEKTREELIIELQELQQQYTSLKASYDNDFAKLKQNEIDLQISEAQKNAILNGISSNIAFVDKDLKIIWANKTAADSVNERPSEMIGQTCHKLWGDPAKPCENCPTLKVFKSKKAEHTILHTPDGKIWEERGEPIFDLDGNLIGVVEIATDITEHKQAEIENERIYKLLEDSQKIGKIGSWEMNVDTLDLKWTKEMYNIHEVDITFQPVVDQRVNFYTPESLPLIDQAMKRTMEFGEPYEIDLEIITAKGNRRSVKTIGRADMENRRILGLFQDITERRQAEKALHDSEDKYRILVENSLVGVVQTKLNGEVLYVNNAFVNMYEATSADEFIGRQMTGVYKYESDRNTVLGLLKKDGRVENFEVVGLTVKGNEKTRLLSAKISGDIINGLVFDITARKQAEEELQKTNAYLQNLINYANAPIIVWDPQFRITRFNHAFETITGRTEAEVLGQSLEILFPSALAEKSMSLIYKTLTGERWETVEIEIQHLNGVVYTVLWNSATLFAPSGNKPVATIAQGQDITRRKLAEEKIRVKNQQLEKLNSEKDKFFSIIAHDLRSPFNGFLGLTEIMAQELHTLSLTELQKISLSLNKSATNLFNLLNNLLEWSRMQQGTTNFKPATHSLLPFVTTTLQPILEIAVKKGIEIVNSVPETLQVLADEDMLSSIIRNLTSNAVKFTKAGGRVSVWAKSTDAGDIEIAVKDSGIGMNTEMLANMFKLDESISRKGTDGEPSTGLGLLLCKDFIEKHGGQIWVESEEEIGSTFYFTLPSGVH